MNQLLEIDSVNLSFGGHPILRNVHLKSERGKVTGLLGRNGTGKSCLLRIIFGELVAESQFVRISGEAQVGTGRSPRKIRYLPQRNFIPPYLTVGRILRDFGVSFSELKDYFPDLSDHFRTKMMELSSGQRRIVEIFALLTSRTDFCLLDEPFSQLMPLHQEKVKELILRERKRKGIILTDHRYEHVLEVSDDLYLLRNGSIFSVDGEESLRDLGYLSGESYFSL